MQGFLHVQLLQQVTWTHTVQKIEVTIKEISPENKNKSARVCYIAHLAHPWAYAPYPLLIRPCPPMCLTRLNPHQHALYVPLTCLMLCLLQLKDKLCFVCSLQLTIHLPSLSLFFYFTMQSWLLAFFLSFILRHWLHHYWYNCFATTYR